MSSLGTSDSFLLPFGEFALESTAHAPKSEDSPRCRLRRGESGSRQEREEAQTCFPIVPDPRQHLLGSSPEETAFDQFRRHSAQSGTEFFWGDPFRDEVQVPAEPLAEWVLEPEFPPLVGRAEQPGEPQRRMAEESARGILGWGEEYGGLEGWNDAGGIATSTLRSLPDLREARGIPLGRVDPVRVPAISEAAGQLQHARPVRAQPDLRSASRRGSELEDAVGEPVEASAEADRARRVQAGAQDGEGFLQPRDRLIEGKT